LPSKNCPNYWSSNTQTKAFKDGGKVRQRVKKASKAYRAADRHTPLPLGENLPWGVGN
jgi:hypothetical protein